MKKYAYEEVEKALQELELKYKHTRIDNVQEVLDVFYLRFVVNVESYLTAVIVDYAKEVLSILIPEVKKDVETTPLMLNRLNDINTKLTYGSLYLNSSKNTLVYKIAISIQGDEAITAAQLAEYIQEIAFLLDEVESWEKDEH